jgi:hypothetical protein
MLDQGSCNGRALHVLENKYRSLMRRGGIYASESASPFS